MACHGPTGSGNPGPAYPHVGGQQSAYVARRLEEYRAGTTTETDPHLFKVMATVAKSLTDQEIQSLASYLQGLHARTGEATAAATTAPAAAPAPAPATPPAAAPTPEAAPETPAQPAPTQS
jgi:cytochrome c553